MRHLKSGRKFGRTSAHRSAMFRNLSISLLEHENIKTTVAKAKDLRSFVEPLITLGSKDSVANRRLAYSKLGNKGAVKKLFEEVGPRFAKRPGGYTRVLKCGYRMGDRAAMAYIALVEDAEPVADKSEKTKAKKVEPKAKAAEPVSAAPAKTEPKTEPKAEPKAVAAKPAKSDK